MGRIPETHACNRKSSKCRDTGYAGRGTVFDGENFRSLSDLGAVARAFLSVGLVWLVSSVAEFLIYTPMLGSGGGYLAFITGNLINMKIPCAVNARDMVGAKPEHRKMKSFLRFPLQPHPLLRFWFWQSVSF